MLAGGGIASAAGQDPVAAAAAAQNEALNNCSMHECWNGAKERLTSFGSAVASWFATPEGQLTSAMVAIAGDMGGGLGGTGGAARTAAADAIEGGAARTAANSASTAIQTYWPPRSGFLTQPVDQTLESGTLVSRYGGFYDKSGNFIDYGNFVAPVNVPYPMRALPPGTDMTRPLSTYQVITPIPNVPTGPASPWFGELGLGIQHQLPLTIQDYLESGALKLINRANPKN